MNTEETLALWRQGKDAWAAWARGVLEKKHALEKAGKWSVDWYGEGQNEETKAWIEEATASFAGERVDGHADFGGLHFPGPTDFDDARFAGTADFTAARFDGNACFEAAQFNAALFSAVKFHGFANFDKARFEADASFTNTEFLKASDLEPCARFHRTRFAKLAEFAGTQFAGAVQFVKTTFAAAQFDGGVFEGDARFTSAQFETSASFVKTRFSGQRVIFRGAHFRGDARFLETRFGGSWAGLVISGACNVSFEAARFEGETSFRQTWFIGNSDFRNAQFNGAVKFDGALFVMPAQFGPAVFSAATSFVAARFIREADFSTARFLEDCDFGDARFGSEALFRQVRFAGAARFAGAEFSGMASFYGASAEAAFTFDGARCTALPEVGEANFAQTPAFEKIVIFTPEKPRSRWWPRWRQEGRSLFSRWTKAAPSGETFEYHPPDFVADQDEAEPDASPGAEEPVVSVKTTAAARATANATTTTIPTPSTSTSEPAEEEVPAAPEENAEATSSASKTADTSGEKRFRILRFAAVRADTPSPPRNSSGSEGSGRARRRLPLLRLFLAWMAAIIAFAPYYLAQRPADFAVEAPASVLPAWPSSLAWDGAPAWLQTPAGAIWRNLDWLSASTAGLFQTGPCVHGNSHPMSEAFFLSAKNALVFVPWEDERVIRRVYGCLYGLDRTEPVMPVAVSHASLIQAGLSLALLAIMLIALNEWLKRKLGRSDSQTSRQ